MTDFIRLTEHIEDVNGQWNLEEVLVNVEDIQSTLPYENLDNGVKGTTLIMKGSPMSAMKFCVISLDDLHRKIKALHSTCVAIDED